MIPEKRGSAYSLPPADYKRLAEHVTALGCFRRTYGRHAVVFVAALCGIALSGWIVTLTDTLWVQLPNGIAAGFFSVQLGLLGHELSHNSLFASKKTNRLFALLIWGLGCGLSESRWFQKHNTHHRSPNHIGHDPDIDIPFVFSPEQAKTRSLFQQRYILPRQHVLFWIGIWFVYPYNILNSMKHLFSQPTKRGILELLLMTAHFVVIFWFTFTFLPPLTALVFNIVVFLTIGAYMAMIFAPNHKGEDMLATEEAHNWVHQITLTRDVTPSPLLSYLFGGLEYQIEHHLFPDMSRFRYQEAQKIVRAFCAEKQIPYHETGWLESLRLIHRSLKAEARDWQHPKDHAV